MTKNLTKLNVPALFLSLVPNSGYQPYSSSINLNTNNEPFSALLSNMTNTSTSPRIIALLKAESRVSLPRARNSSKKMKYKYHATLKCVLIISYALLVI